MVYVNRRIVLENMFLLKFNVLNSANVLHNMLKTNKLKRPCKDKYMH